MSISLWVLIVVSIVVIFTIIALVYYNRLVSKSKITNLFSQLNNEETEFKFFSWERKLLDKMQITQSKRKNAVILIRTLIALCIIASYYFFGFIGIAFIIAIGIAKLFDDLTTRKVEESGVTTIGETLSFIDMFVPQIISGSSCRQAFLKYIQRQPSKSPIKEMLETYFSNKDNVGYTVPKRIRAITEIYEDAYYGEQTGNQNYIAVIEEEKEDLFQMQQSYIKFRSSIDTVIKPVKLSFYIFLPLIVFITWGMTEDFWITLAGFVVMLIVLAIFIAFNWLLYKLSISTLKVVL